MHEKVASVIGPSYIAAFALGGVRGMLQLPTQPQRRTYRLMINTYLNNIGKTSSRYANYTGAAVFLYLAVGKTINYIFQEELEG